MFDAKEKGTERAMLGQCLAAFGMTFTAAACLEVWALWFPKP